MNRSLLLCAAVLFAACDSGTEPDLQAGTVFVGNQGNFSDGDGSVTAYDLEAATAAEALVDLRTIIQSLASDGTNLYIASNTGGRVDVYPFDRDELGSERVAQIEVENPRYVAFFDDEAFVTSQLFSRPSEVAVVDRATFSVTETVEVGGFAEDIVAVNGRVFVATGAFGGSQEVVVLDAGSNQVVQRVDVGCASPRQLEVDADVQVWVFCEGTAGTDSTAQIDGEIVILDAASGEIAERVAVDGLLSTAGPGQTAFASAGSVFAVRDRNTVLRFDADSNALAATIPVSGDDIGAIAYDRAAERLYLGRVPGFTTAGSVTIHEPDGTQVGMFTAGVAPTFILFR